MTHGHWRWLGLIAVTAATLACSDENNGSTGNVSGAWCGLDVANAAACVGDEAFYVELTQSGTAVTGTWCEDSEKTDCYEITDGALVEKGLTFSYDLPPTDTVDGTFTLNGDQLAGTLYTTKCDCDIDVTLHRLD